MCRPTSLSSGTSQRRRHDIPLDYHQVVAAAEQQQQQQERRLRQLRQQQQQQRQQEGVESDNSSVRPH